eukprot:GILK01003727.1.p1 GENE.GILK01003727.1~~GILK01003727.1.p1  ORF type:complete len:253 (-),score=50.14 GILK01003727.1:242-958(-)
MPKEALKQDHERQPTKAGTAHKESSHKHQAKPAKRKSDRNGESETVIPDVKAGKKRKRTLQHEEKRDEEIVDGTHNNKKSRKERSTPASDGAEVVPKSKDPSGKVAGLSASKPSKGATKRFIVFVGNLPYSATDKTVHTHFTSVGRVKSVRLQTTRPDNKPKGCGFVEFFDAPTMRKALLLHHQEFEGRKINVELTAGGGGKGANRVNKLQQRNDKLREERQKIHEKIVKAKVSAPKQ